MENKEEKLLKEIKRILSYQDQIIDSKVSKAVLKQTGIFFISLGLLIALWTAGFGLVINRIGNFEDRISKKIESISEEITNNKIQMTRLESEVKRKPQQK